MLYVIAGGLRWLGRADDVQGRLNVRVGDCIFQLNLGSIFQLSLRSIFQLNLGNIFLLSLRSIFQLTEYPETKENIKVFCPVKMIHCLVPCSNMNCNSDCAVQGIFHR